MSCKRNLYFWGAYAFVKSRRTFSKVGVYSNFCSKMYTENSQEMLAHTATHCNTLQHTATQCNTLQHTATHCNTLQHTTTHCNALQHTATHTNAPLRKVRGVLTTVKSIWLGYYEYKVDFYDKYLESRRDAPPRYGSRHKNAARVLLQCVVVCCSVSWHSVLQCITVVCCSVWWRGSLLQCVVVCCSVSWRGVVVCCSVHHGGCCSVFGVVVCCSVYHGVALPRHGGATPRFVVWNHPMSGITKNKMSGIAAWRAAMLWFQRFQTFRDYRRRVSPRHDSSTIT